jgi:hypothetical protein
VSEPIQRLQDIATLLLDCLCTAVSGNANPPAHCCLRVGDQVVHDADISTDLCCEGLAYVTVGDIFPVVDSFPEQSIVSQANQVCSFPSWAVNLRMGIVRCAPVGGNLMPTCAEWTATTIQNLVDAQSLATAACCFKENWLILEPGLSVTIGPNSTVPPQGGCLERFVTLIAQTTVCPAC